MTAIALANARCSHRDTILTDMSDDKLSLDDPRLKTAEENALALEVCLSHIERSAPVSNDKWLVTSLLKSTRRAYGHLRNGWPNDSTYTAWACRNLLELRVFTKYIVRSSDDRKRFISHLVLDFEQSTEAQKKLTAQVAPELSLDDNDSLLGELRTIKQNLGFVENRYLSAADLAKELNLEEEFGVMNKICSKLVHPTALSILLIDLAPQTKRDVLLLHGCAYLEKLLRDILPFAETLAPPGVHQRP